jgi:hypothetical protein
MSNNGTGGVGSPNGSGAVMDALMATGDGLTPDALFSYCSARINGIDAQVKEAFAQQQQNNDTQAAIGDLMASLNQAITGGTDGSNNYVQATIGWYWNAINKAGGPNTPEGQKLFQAMRGFCEQVDSSHRLRDVASDPNSADFKGMMAGAFGNDKQFIEEHLQGHFGNKDGVVDKDTIDATVKALQNDSDELGKGGELMMIKLQSLMSQRQLAVQITTNLIQTLHDASKSIVQNIHT